MKAVLVAIVGLWLTLLCGFSTEAVPITPITFTAPKPAVSTLDVRCLTEAIYFEARGESEHGQRAVAEVVMNRRDRGFARSICGVVYAKAQFSWTARRHAVRDRMAFARCRELAFAILAGDVERNNRKILYFFSGRKPLWARKLHRDVRIGKHLFLW